MRLLRINDNEWINVTAPRHIEARPHLNEVAIDSMPVPMDAGNASLFVVCLADWIASATKTTPKVLTPAEVLAKYQGKHEPKPKPAEDEE